MYCITSVQKIIESNLEYLFTDGHAVDSFSTQYGVRDIENIDAVLYIKSIQAKYWKDESDLDLKRRKEAEFLVLGDIPNTAVLGYLVYNETAKQSFVILELRRGKFILAHNLIFRA